LQFHGKPITYRNPEDEGNIFSETSVIIDTAVKATQKAVFFDKKRVFTTMITKFR
jgi:hypothetical protein